MVPVLVSPCDKIRMRRTKPSMATMAAASRRIKVCSSSTSIIVKIRSYRRGRRQQKGCPRADWSNILCHVLEDAQKKLPMGDTLTCRGVCSRWRSITCSHLSSSLDSAAASAAQQPPLFIWNAPTSYYSHCFLDVARPGGDQLYYPSHELEQLLRGEMMGSVDGYSNGWFLISDWKKSYCLRLFHPMLFSGASVRLPPIVPPKGFPPILNPRIGILNSKKCVTVDKVVLWGDPVLSNGNYGIAVIHPRYKNILFAKSGSVQFNNVGDQGFDKNMPYRWQDIICFRNCIYSVSLGDNGRHHHMEAWDCGGEGDVSPRKVLDFQPKFSPTNVASRYTTLHLVESEGELLLVSIQRPDNIKLRKIRNETCAPPRQLFVLGRSPNAVRVYKMDFLEKEWKQMDSLGDRVLFIMEDRNLCVTTLEFPQYKRNTVYFYHFIDIGCHRCCIGVFNMEDGSTNEIWPELE